MGAVGCIGWVLTVLTKPIYVFKFNLEPDHGYSQAITRYVKIASARKLCNC